MLIVLTSAVLCAAWAAETPGLQAAGRPASAGRVTRRFDFEERQTNPTDLPRNWIRAQHDPPSRLRPGFPLWNKAVLDYDVSHAGQGSVRLPTRGGSASLRLDPGLIPVFPDADYTVTASVRTVDVAHARASIVARLLDASGRPIPGAESVSEPAHTGGAWETLTVRILGDSPEAASLQIELLLEQPAPAADKRFEDIEIVPEDFTGAAWFDEIAVVQIPRVELWTPKPGNLFRADEQPAVTLFLRDLVGQPLEVRFEAVDVTGRVVARETMPFDGGRLETTWTPAINRFGWYRVRVLVSQDGQTVGGAATDLVWRGPPSSLAATGSPPAMTASVLGVPTDGLPELGDLALDAGLAGVMTDLWFDGAPADATRRDALSLLANRITPRGRELTITLGGLPPEIDGPRGLGGLLDALAEPASAGAAWLDPALIDLGHRVRRWALGQPDDSLGDRAADRIDAARSRLRDLVPGAVLEAPVSVFETLPPALVVSGTATAQHLGDEVPLELIGGLVDAFTSAVDPAGRAGWDPPSQILAFDAGNSGQVGVPSALAGLVLSALHARAAIDQTASESAVPRILRIDGAWRWQDGRRAELMPGPEAAAWLALADRLAGRDVQPLGEIAPGVMGLLLASPDSARPAAAVFWQGALPDAPTEAALLLAGSDVAQIDLFGNSRVVRAEPLGETALYAHRIDLSQGPAFVEGVDAGLVRFAARVAVEPARVSTRVDGDGFEVLVTNPWPGPIRGDYFLVEPGGLSGGDEAARGRSWDLSPRHGSFTVEEGATQRLPISADTSAAVATGRHPLVLDFRLNSPSFDGSVRVSRTIEAGLSDLRLDLVARYGPDPDGPDAVIYAIVTNTGAAARVVDLYAGATGYPRQRSAPMPVAPGRPAVKVFSFEGGRDALAGTEIGVSLFIREEGARLRRTILLDDGR